MDQSKSKYQIAKKDDMRLEDKPPKVVDRFPSRSWNIEDFVGKYHLSKFKNKLHPLPGTQVFIEQEYEADKQRFEEYQRLLKEENEKKLKLKLYVKQQSVGVQTKVLFDTLLNQPIDEAEKLLEEKEALLKQYNHPTYQDNMKEIMKFWKNCQQGKYHYVGYCVSNGFRSIDYQDPESGDYALHLAVRQGNVNLIEELLKFKANPDVKNNKGNYPIHEAWHFWNMDPNTRTKEERLEQEETTCKVLLTLLSYNAFIDAVDYHKQTALHIASRIGTVRAVKILLTFHADVSLKTKYNETAIELAKEFQQDESYRLLAAWDHIKQHFIHSDFHIVWHQFLSNYESEIKQSKPAEVMLSELELERNAKMMSQLSKERTDKKDGSTVASSVIIDDPLLQAACYLARKDDNAKIPKPWEAGWKKYVKQVKNAASLELKKKMDNLQAKLRASQQSQETSDGNAVGVAGGEKETGVMVVDQYGEKRPLKKRIFPDLPVPLTWAEREQLKKEATEIAEAKAKKKADPYKGYEFDDLSDDEFENEGVGSVSIEASSVTNASSLYNDVFQPSIKQNQRSAEELYYLQDPKESNLTRRRKQLAQKVCTDAKFLKFTRRKANDSALLLPLRSPQAPLKHTEEDGNILRMIVSQGIEYERMDQHRQKSKLEEMFGIVKLPKKNSIGAYCEELEMNKFGERDRLLDSLASNTKSAADILHKNDDQKARKNPKFIDLDKKSKVDMVNDRRPRYVDPYLLPVVKEVSQVDKLIRSQQKKDDEASLKKQGLSSEKDRERAMLEMQTSINLKSKSGGVEDEEDEKKKQLEEEMTINRSGSTQRQRSASEKQRSMRRLFLEKPLVHYGEGRLTSSHNMKGKLEEPWTTVGGRYNTLPGDRTA